MNYDYPDIMCRGCGKLIDNLDCIAQGQAWVCPDCLNDIANAPVVMIRDPHTDKSDTTAVSTPTPSPSDPSLSQLRVENKKLREALETIAAIWKEREGMEGWVVSDLMNHAARAALASTKEGK